MLIVEPNMPRGEDARGNDESPRGFRSAALI
jgi:hypothetical protein